MGVTHFSGISAPHIELDNVDVGAATVGTLTSGRVVSTTNSLGLATVGTLTANALYLGNSALRGTRTITTGGSGVVNTTRVGSTSVIVLTPVISTTGYYKGANATVKTIVNGTSFKICLFTGMATAATGVVRWAIFNTA